MGSVVWILFGGIAFIIYVLIYTAKAGERKRRRILEQAVAGTAAQNHLVWTQTDIDKHRAIAWCLPERILFFMDFSVADGHRQLIHMDRVATCRIVNHYSADAERKAQKADRNISMVELEVVFTDKHSVALCMYSELVDGVFEKMRLSEKARNLETLITKK